LKVTYLPAIASTEAITFPSETNERLAKSEPWLIEPTSFKVIEVTVTSELETLPEFSKSNSATSAANSPAVT
jgi:hypothetical protein